MSLLTRRIALFRDLPSDNWRSMEMYADTLQAKFKEKKLHVHSVVPRLTSPPWWGYLPHIRRTYTPRNWSYYNQYLQDAPNRAGDINHIIDHSAGHLLEVLDPEKTIITCHDLIPLHKNLPVNASLEARHHRKMFERSVEGLKKAKRIICVSKATRDDIVKRLGCNEEKIRVIPIPIEKEFFEPISSSKRNEMKSLLRDMPRPWVLSVGRNSPNKNLETSVAVTAELGGSIVRVGVELGESQTEALNGNLIHIKSPDAESLAALMSCCDVLIFPSFAEGFGMPVAEALAVGLPVITSNTTSLPEIVGNSIPCYEPTNILEMVARMTTLVIDETIRASAIRRGKTQAQLYHPDKVIKQTLAVYKEFLK